MGVRLKVAVITSEAEARSGYLNVMPRDPAPEYVSAGSPMQFACCPLLDNLGGVVHPGEATEVYVPSAVDFLVPETADLVIRHWAERVGRAGR
jgi:hypothetical protein